MTFLWPGLLALLALVPILVAIYAWSLRRRRPAGVRYSSLALVREAAPGSSRVRRHLPFALFSPPSAALVVALGRPVAVVAVPTNQTTIILTIDVSRSMCSTDIPPSRLLAAEEAAASFVRAPGRRPPRSGSSPSAASPSSSSRRRTTRSCSSTRSRA